MTWGYQQSTGDITRDGAPVGIGYSGTGAGRNNPEMQYVPNVGPIPVGTYSIGPARADGHLGPCVMDLDPVDGTDTHGRSEFRIHGNDAADDASHGCIVAGPGIRNAIALSTDRTLTVIS